MEPFETGVLKIAVRCVARLKTERPSVSSCQMANDLRRYPSGQRTILGDLNARIAVQNICDMVAQDFAWKAMCAFRMQQVWAASIPLR